MIEQQEIYYRYIRQPYEAGLDLVLPDADDWDYDIILDAIYAELDRRKGFVYILANSRRNLYKVGMTRKGVEKRVRGVNSAGLVERWWCERSFAVPDVFLEKRIHKHLIAIKPEHIREIFMLPLNLIERVIEEEIQSFNRFLSGLP